MRPEVAPESGPTHVKEPISMLIVGMTHLWNLKNIYTFKEIFLFLILLKVKQEDWYQLCLFVRFLHFHVPSYLTEELHM